MVSQVFHQQFTEHEIALRPAILSKEFNNEAGAKKMVDFIWGII